MTKGSSSDLPNRSRRRVESKLPPESPAQFSEYSPTPPMFHMNTQSQGRSSAISTRNFTPSTSTRHNIDSNVLSSKSQTHVRKRRSNSSVEQTVHSGSSEMIREPGSMGRGGRSLVDPGAADVTVLQPSSSFPSRLPWWGCLVLILALSLATRLYKVEEPAHIW